MTSFASGRVARLAALALFATLQGAARAADEVTFRVEFNDGIVTPRRIEVPANRRIVLELVNKGKTPAEFESKELRKEKVLAPGSASEIVLRALDPGEYEFFDDFHPEAPPAVLVAK